MNTGPLIFYWAKSSDGAFDLFDEWGDPVGSIRLVFSAGCDWFCNSPKLQGHATTLPLAARDLMREVRNSSSGVKCIFRDMHIYQGAK